MGTNGNDGNDDPTLLHLVHKPDGTVDVTMHGPHSPVTQLATQLAEQGVNLNSPEAKERLAAAERKERGCSNNGGRRYYTVPDWKGRGQQKPQ